MKPIYERTENIANIADIARGPEVRVYPSYVQTGPCEALSCKWRGYAISACKEEGCGHRWQREGVEDRNGRGNEFNSLDRPLHKKEGRL